MNQTNIENARILINSQDEYLIISDEPLPLNSLHSIRQSDDQAVIMGKDSEFTLTYKFPEGSKVFVWSPPAPGKPEVVDAVPLERVA